MSCCGRRRSEWRMAQAALSPLAVEGQTPPSAETGSSPRLFEYLGNEALKITGAYSSNPYHFRFPGDRVLVAYEDSFAMMGEQDLKWVVENS